MIPTVHNPLDDLLQSIEREIMTVGRKTMLYYSGSDLLETSIRQSERMTSMTLALSPVRTITDVKNSTQETNVPQGQTVSA